MVIFCEFLYIFWYRLGHFEIKCNPPSLSLFKNLEKGTIIVSMGNKSGKLSDMELKEVRQNVEQLIQTNKIVVFSKSYCPYAMKAKQTLDHLTKNYLVIELNGHPQGNEIQEILGQMTGASTVPRVFIGGVCIGGGDDTVRLWKSGELERMVG